MNLPTDATEQVKELMAALHRRDYAEIQRRGWLGRLTVSELEGAVIQYGRTLDSPPVDFLDQADIYTLNDGSGWSVDVPLWTVEEGLSDLTLSLDVKTHANKFSVGISDLHVL